jgi:hypothetical protein
LPYFRNNPCSMFFRKKSAHMHLSLLLTTLTKSRHQFFPIPKKVDDASCIREGNAIVSNARAYLTDLSCSKKIGPNSCNTFPSISTYYIGIKKYTHTPSLQHQRLSTHLSYPRKDTRTMRHLTDSPSPHTFTLTHVYFFHHYHQRYAAFNPLPEPPCIVCIPYEEFFQKTKFLLLKTKHVALRLSM